MSDDLLAQFLIEGREQVEAAETSLARLRRQRDDADALDACFRAVHTLKGSAGILGLAAMGRLLHGAEDQLTRLRHTPGTPTETAFLTEAIDQVDRWLAGLEQTGQLPPDADSCATAILTRSPQTEAASSPVAPPGARAGLLIRYTPRPDAYFAGDDPIALVSQAPGLVDLEVSPRDPFGDLGAYDPFNCNLVIEARCLAARRDVEPIFRLVSDQVTLTEIEPERAVPADADPVQRTLRVAVDRVDRLAELTDELVLGRGGLTELARQAAELPGGQALARALGDRQAHDDRLMTALHAAVARLRLVPLSPLFARFPRIVRDTARALDKTVDLEVEAGDAELDRSLADGLFEPLLHVLRNAVDHGVEPADQRRAAGKPEAANVRLTARTEGDRVIVEVRDEGAGIAPERLRARAVRLGLLDAAAAAALSENAALELIFHPGFSTRDTISEVSGRGVGMDAVRRAVARLGGQVTLASELGRGLCVRFDLPMALKLSRLLVVRCGAERYAFDLAEVLQAVSLGAGDITPIRAGQGFVWREQAIPLVSLARLAGVGGARPDLAGPVIVVRTPAGPLGLAVDRIVERIEAVVRPPAGLLAAAPVVSGAALADDGGVLMMLDPAELVRWA